MLDLVYMNDFFFILQSWARGEQTLVIIYLKGWEIEN